MTNGVFFTSELPVTNTIHSDDRILILYNATGVGGSPTTMMIPVNNLKFDSISFGNTMITTGVGSPENAVSANIGSMYLRTDGGALTTFYVKETGSGKIGWSAK